VCWVEVLAPECGQDLAIQAVQDAHALGIRTLALGIGDLLGANLGCQPEQMRCGTDHLQDLANAGIGWTVQAPPEVYKYYPCVTNQRLLARYGAPTADAPYYTGVTVEDLRVALNQMLERVLDGAVP